MLNRVFLLWLVGSFSVMAADNAWIAEAGVDSFTDLKTATLYKTAEQGESKWGQPYVMRVRCTSGRPVEVYVYWGDHLSSRAIKIDWRFDEQSMRSAEVMNSTDGKSTFIQGTHKAGFIAGLKSASRLMIRAYDFYGTPVTPAVFQLAGFAAGYQKTCGWRVAELEKAAQDQLKKDKAEIEGYVVPAANRKQYDECMTVYNDDPVSAVQCTKVFGQRSALPVLSTEAEAIAQHRAKQAKMVRLQHAECMTVYEKTQCDATFGARGQE